MLIKEETWLGRGDRGPPSIPIGGQDQSLETGGGQGRRDCLLKRADPAVEDKGQAVAVGWRVTECGPGW